METHEHCTAVIGFTQKEVTGLQGGWSNSERASNGVGDSRWSAVLGGGGEWTGDWFI